MSGPSPSDSRGRARQSSPPPPPSSFDMLQNQLRRKHAVCGLLHSGYTPRDADQYTYVPERCVRTKKRGANSRSSPAQTTRNNRRRRPNEAPRAAYEEGSRAPLDVFSRDHAAVRALRLRFPALPYENARQELSPEELDDPRMVRQELTLMRYGKAAFQFVNDAFPRMITKAVVVSEPDPLVRAENLLRTWGGGELKKRGRRIYAEIALGNLFALMDAHYDVMEAQENDDA